MYQNNPDNLRFIMVDPKRVELTTYNNIPYLLTPCTIQPEKGDDYFYIIMPIKQ